MAHDDVSLYGALFANPGYLLALALSTPSGILETDQANAQQVILDIRGTDVTATVRRSPGRPPTTRILASKDTIFAAILIEHLMEQRDPAFAESLTERLQRYSRSQMMYNMAPALSLDPSSPMPWPPTPSRILEELGATPGDLEVARSRTQMALAFLEDEGLAVDPVFAPGLMVLAGLVPVHFSVRTPKGDRILRGVKIHAPMWSLEVQKVSQGDHANLDFDFRFRAVAMIRSALTALAAQYLDSEEGTRWSKGKPILKPSGPPTLDPDQDS
jgi:hypothetical protein